MAVKRRKPSRARRVFLGALWGFWTLAFLGIGTTLGWLSTSEQLAPGKILSLVKTMRTDPKEVFHEDAMNILVLGCDEDLYYGGKTVLKHAARSDMMLVARLDFARKRITGISIPRDTRCDLPGYGIRKINAYHAIATYAEGPDLARRAVEHLLSDEVKIDRVVVIDYEAFMKFVDLIGGVEVSTPIPLKYTDRAGGLYIDIPKGTSRQDGYGAMGYVRIRKHAGDDYMRQDRQKQLLVAIKTQVSQQWTQIPRYVDAGVKVLGNTFDFNEITALAAFAGRVPKKDIVLGQLPTRPGRGSFLLIDERKARRAVAEAGLTGEDPATVAKR
ncbi:hypothetical protein EON81_23605 [bacterium]|nr:MAG: hypothetical protein EON81_23605 [bacterium]